MQAGNRAAQAPICSLETRTASVFTSTSQKLTGSIALASKEESRLQPARFGSRGPNLASASQTGVHRMESPEVAKDRGLAGSDLTIAPKRSLALGLTLQEAAPSCWLSGDGEAPAFTPAIRCPFVSDDHDLRTKRKPPFRKSPVPRGGAKLNVDPTMVMSAHTSAQDKNSDTTEECTSIAARRLVTEAMRVRQENMPILGKNIAELSKAPKS
ncbi:hypothetical protein B0H13DRAFT_1913877 [Mycena leptocephala]|nr:hypothetical protein B0H13DRAFT_1913877 [Mycena leptocephala]